MKKYSLLICILFFIVGSTNVFGQISPSTSTNTIYVDSSAHQGNGTGDSWDNAVLQLADALKWAKEHSSISWANQPLKIFVAKGTYHPKYSSIDSDNFISSSTYNAFVMVKDVQVYGGFDPSNGITNLTHQRIIGATNGTRDQGTILDGENSYILVISSGELGTALLDGFSITKGKAMTPGSENVNGHSIFYCSGGGTYNSVTTMVYRNVFYYNNEVGESGGGMFSYLSNLTLDNIRFENNNARHGGAFANQNRCNVTIRNSSFINNIASNDGGAIYNVDTSIVVHYNVHFQSNYASNGGAIATDDMAQSKVYNATFINNSVGGKGGAVYVTNKGTAQLTNVTFSKNSAYTEGDVLYVSLMDQPASSLHNAIVFGNAPVSGVDKIDIVDQNQSTLISHSYLEESSWNTNWGVNNGTNIITIENPFNDDTNGDYSLAICSAATNAGSNTAYQAIAQLSPDADVDFAHSFRLVQNLIDMGAYESNYLNLGSDLGYCIGTPFTTTLDAQNIGSTYLWNNGSTAQTQTFTSAGTYSVNVYITSGNGCILKDTIIVTELILPIVDLGVDATTCVGSPFTLTLDAQNTGSTYLWNNGTTTQTQTITSAGTYSVIVTNANGCIAKDTIVVTELILPIVDLGVDATTCVGSPFTLTLDAQNTGATYLWNNGTTTQTQTITSAGTYSVIVTNVNGCIAKDTIVVTELTLPIVDLGVDATICVGNSLTLDAQNTGATYMWNNGSTTQTQTITDAGIYSVIVTNANGCTANDTIVVTEQAFPTATSLTSSHTSEDCGFTFTVLNPMNVVTYDWNFSAGNTLTTTTNTASFVFETAGTYIVSVQLTGVCGTIVKQDTVNCVISDLSNESISGNKNIKIYPNPTSEWLNVAFNDYPEGAIEFTMSDVTGKIIFNQQYTSTSNIQINVSEFEAGIYNYQLNQKSTGLTTNGKVMIQ